MAHPDAGPVLVDHRVGSLDLKPSIESLGLQVEVRVMTYGDFAFSGRSSGGGPCMVGVERKRLRDILASVEDGRFATFQLGGLLDTYEHVFLVVEGIWRSNPDSGAIETLGHQGWRPVFRGIRPYHYRMLDSWLTTLQLKTSVCLRTTQGPRDTAILISNLYDWFNSKDWEDHHSHLSLQTSRPRLVAIEPPTLCRRVAKEFYHIGWERSLQVETEFRTVYRAVNAGAAEWRKIQGVGEQTASRIIREIRGADFD